MHWDGYTVQLIKFKYNIPLFWITCSESLTNSNIYPRNGKYVSQFQISYRSFARDYGTEFSDREM